MYRKCPKLLYTGISDKMAYENSVDPDLSAPSGSTLFAILLLKYFNPKPAEPGYVLPLQTV